MLNGYAGAWLWIAAQADDASSFKARVEHAMRDLHLHVADYEDIQRVEPDSDISDEVRGLIPEAQLDFESVVCGTWHKYKVEDA